MGYHVFNADNGLHRFHAGPVVPRMKPGDALGDKTYFTIFARWPREVRLFSIEWALIETEVEALAVLKETENAVLVFRNDPDVPRTDVSEDLARTWLHELNARGISLSGNDLPSFIREHLSEDEIAQNNWAHAAE